MPGRHVPVSPFQLTMKHHHILIAIAVGLVAWQLLGDTKRAYQDLTLKS